MIYPEEYHGPFKGGEKQHCGNRIVVYYVYMGELCRCWFH